MERRFSLYSSGHPLNTRAGKNSRNKKELQHASRLLFFWRRHIPDFAIIARLLYDLLRKGAAWEWAPAHDEALQLLVSEANTHRALGPVHPTDLSRLSGGLHTQDCPFIFGKKDQKVLPARSDFTPGALGMLRNGTLIGKKGCL